MFRILFEYKELIWYKAWADLRSEARRYYISYAWWILEPIFEMLIFYLIFGLLLSRGGKDFIQFLLVGLVAFKWFGTTVQHCGNSIIYARGIISQSAIPKIVFPTINIVVDTFKACIVMFIVGIFLNGSGFKIGGAYMALPAVFFVQLLLIVAIGYLLASIVPFLPDISILVSLSMRILFYLSGIFYDPKTISEGHRKIFFLNPIAKLIDMYRGILLHNELPEFMPLLRISIASVFVMLIAYLILIKNDKKYPRIVIQ